MPGLELESDPGVDVTGATDETVDGGFSSFGSLERDEREDLAVDVHSALDDALLPGLAAEQAIHLASSALFWTRHTSHDQPPAGCFGSFRSGSVRSAGTLRDNEPLGLLTAATAGDLFFAGFLAVHATHSSSVALFLTMHWLHSHDPAAGTNWASGLKMGACDLESVLAFRAEGLGAVHATHLPSLAWLRTRFWSHSHPPDGGANCGSGLRDGTLDVESVLIVLTSLEGPLELTAGPSFTGREDLAPHIVLIPVPDLN